MPDRLDPGGRLGACSSPKSYSALADGSHKFEVRAIDQAGNTDATPASFSWTVDTTAPVVSIDSGPSGLTNDPTPTFTFSSEPGLNFECSLDTGAPSFGPCSGNGTHTPPAPLADGPYTFRVRTADAAGNPGSATQSFTVDTTAPDAPELTATVPASPANNNSPKIFGSAEAGSTVRLFITNDCSGDPIATATAAELTAGISVSVPDDSLTRFRATTTSSIGNPSSCSAALTYVEDSTAPETQIDSSPQALSSSATASFSFSGTDTGGSGVASFQCRLDSSEAAAWAACASPKSYSALAAGSHKFEVRAIDHSGNTDATPASFSWTVDTTAPNTTITQNPAALVGSAAAEFKFNGDDGTGTGVASFQCRLDSSEAAAWVACSSPKSYSALADGSHKFEVRAIDQAGNTDASPASFTWTVDTTAPNTTITQNPAALVASGAAEFKFNGDDGTGSGVASFQCRIDSTQAAAWASCSSPKSYTGLADGSHSFEVRAIDQAANTDGTPASFSWTVDTTAPVVSIDSGPSGLTNDPTPTFTFSSEPGASFECSIDTGTPDYGACSGNGTHTPATPLADGPYTFRVRATDAAGNPGSATQNFTLDTAAPDAPELTATVPASPANNNSPEIFGSAEAGSTVRLFITNDCSGDPLATGTAAELAAGISVSVSDDSLTRFRATTTSSIGNPSPCSAALTYVEDSTAPETQIDTGPSGQSGSSSASFGFSGTDTGGSGVASFQCRIDSSEAADWGSCSSPKSYSSLIDGSHTFEVRAIDQAGNIEATPASSTWTVDTTPPVVSIDSGPSGVTNDATPTFTFSSEPGLAFECSIDTGSPSFGPCSGIGTHTPSSPLADGPYTFRVRTADAAGNPGVADPRLQCRGHRSRRAQPDRPGAGVPGERQLPEDRRLGAVRNDRPALRRRQLLRHVVATFPASSLATGLTVSVADNSTTSFSATATSGAESRPPAHMPSLCRGFIAPDTSITDHPPAQSDSKATPSSPSPGPTGPAPASRRSNVASTPAPGRCSSPLKYSSLADGTHSFEVRAKDAATTLTPRRRSSNGAVDTSPSTEPNQPAPPTGTGPHTTRGRGSIHPRGHQYEDRERRSSSSGSRAPVTSRPARHRSGNRATRSEEQCEDERQR